MLIPLSLLERERGGGRYGGRYRTLHNATANSENRKIKRILFHISVRYSYRTNRSLYDISSQRYNRYFYLRI